MKSLPLNGEWDLWYGDRGQVDGPAMLSSRLDGWLRAVVPGDVHADLVRAGVIEEPLWGENAEACRWMEEKEWWYRLRFDVPADFLGDRVELSFDGLDTTASIWLNGTRVGQHNNMFVPVNFDVTGILRAGSNELVVCLDVGAWSVEDVSEADRLKYSFGQLDVTQYPRNLIRKAQFVYAWDWAPRLVTCGIWRGVKLCSYTTAALRDVYLQTRLADGQAIIHVQAEVDLLAATPLDGELSLSLTGPGNHAASLSTTLTPGKNTVWTDFVIRGPKLWWPHGSGEPTLYDFALDLYVGDAPAGHYSCRYGLREVTLVQEPLPGGEGQSFIIAVNGVPIYCKGADWVPADSLLARVTPEKYEALVQLASEANFNMFRIWGGGIYEDEAYFEACDRHGIMVWHDFMFACGYYPDDNPSFMAEVGREAMLVVRRLRNHPSLVLWCGNNENEWLHYMQTAYAAGRVHHGERIYHELLPEVCGQLDPSRPYWPSSPYGGYDPNSALLGDRHSWDVSIMSLGEARAQFGRHAEDQAKFVTEFGFLAPPVRRSLEKFLPKAQIDPGAAAWLYHNNTFEGGILKQALRVHFGLALAGLPIEAYLIYTQTYQAEALKFALGHYRRRKFRCAGSLFWMYSDCWGATSGWSIVDYYLARKPSFYAVQRVFAPRMVSLCEQDNQAQLWIVNDALEAWEAIVEFGTAGFGDAHVSPNARLRVWVPANSACHVGTFELAHLSPQERTRVFAYARLFIDGQLVSQDRLFLASYRELHMQPATVDVALEQTTPTDWQLTASSDTFAFMVQLDAPEGVEFSDNWFDLLPGLPHRVKVTGQETQVRQLQVRPLNSSSEYRRLSDE